MTNLRFRRVAMTGLAVACAGTLAACGSSAHTSTTGSGSGAASGPGAGASRVGFKLTATQQACLKKHGVTLGFGGHRPGGTPPAGANAKRPTSAKRGAFPHGADRSGFAAQFAKRRAALKACGVSLPSRAGGAGPGGSGAGGAGAGGPGGADAGAGGSGPGGAPAAG